MALRLFVADRFVHLHQIFELRDLGDEKVDTASGEPKIQFAVIFSHEFSVSRVHPDTNQVFKRLRRILVGDHPGFYQISDTNQDIHIGNFMKDVNQAQDVKPCRVGCNHGHHSRIADVVAYPVLKLSTSHGDILFSLCDVHLLRSLTNDPLRLCRWLYLYEIFSILMGVIFRAFGERFTLFFKKNYFFDCDKKDSTPASYSLNALGVYLQYLEYLRRVFISIGRSIVKTRNVATYTCPNLIILN